jgi:hypothetical protein
MGRHEHGPKKHDTMTIVLVPGTTRRSASAWAGNSAHSAGTGTTWLNDLAGF